jgi:putative PIN family toxin of toxin-antitoxin system
VRAILDPNVIISALLSPDGSPARALREWQQGGFELIVSPLLLAELERALAYPKLRRRIDPEDAKALVDWLARAATTAPDPARPPPVRSPDPGDDYLIALAAAQGAVIVSGDAHLLQLVGKIPVHSPADFLDSIQTA